MTVRIAYFVFLRSGAKNMAAKFKGRAKCEGSEGPKTPLWMEYHTYQKGLPSKGS